MSLASERLTIVDCAELNEARREAARELVISEEQVEFGGSFEGSLNLIASEQGETLRGYCLLKLDDIVGLVVLKRPPSSPDWVPQDAVSLHGLKIDKRWQGHGFGKEAFVLAARQAAVRWPDARQLVLSVDAGNAAALAVYRGFGMADSGPIYFGRVGKEHRLSVDLCSK